MAYVAGLMLGLGSSAATADAYLDALKAEASSDAVVTSLDAKKVEEGRTDDQAQMEEWLRSEFMGSYVFYQKLSETKKKAVYRAYRAGAPIAELRDKINELLTQ